MAVQRARLDSLSFLSFFFSLHLIIRGIWGIRLPQRDSIELHLHRIFSDVITAFLFRADRNYIIEACSEQIQCVKSFMKLSGVWFALNALDDASGEFFSLSDFIGSATSLALSVYSCFSYVWFRETGEDN